MQLDLFEEENESTILKNEIQSLQKKMQKMNSNYKLQFQQVMKMCIQLKDDVDRMNIQLSTVRREMPSHKENPNPNSDLLEKLFAEAYEM